MIFRKSIRKSKVIRRLRCLIRKPLGGRLPKSPITVQFRKQPRCYPGMRSHALTVIDRHQDLLMDHGRDQLMLAFTSPGSIGKPTYVGAGIATAGGGNVSTLTELEHEIERVPITIWSRESNRARMTAVFASGVGVGDWVELGLFDADANDHLLYACNTVGSFTSGNAGYPQPDTSDAKEGTASLKTVGTDTASFLCNNGLEAYANTFTEAGRFQLWYYVDDPDKITTQMGVYLSSHAANVNLDCYYWTYNKAVLSAGWNLFSKKFSEKSGENGNPNKNALITMSIPCGKDASATEKIDKLRLFEEAGNMWARAELETVTEKQWGEARHIYWYMTFIIPSE